MADDWDSPTLEIAVRDLLVRRQYGPYAVEMPLGAGAAAVVYRARDTRTSATVALKVVPLQARGETASTRFAQRTTKEFEVMRDLRHPNIVRVLDFDRDAPNFASSHDTPCLWMALEWMAGGTLFDKLRTAPVHRLPLDEACAYTIQIALALHAIHQARPGFPHGLIHRDVKPENILVDGADLFHVLLADFGIATSTEDTILTQVGQILGTPYYMAPERFRGGEIDGRSDLYSLGCIFFEMLAGRAPYLGDTAHALSYQHVHEPLPNLRHFAPQTPRGVLEVLARVLAKDPRERYQTGQQFARALDPIMTAYGAEIWHRRTTQLLRDSFGANA